MLQALGHVWLHVLTWNYCHLRCCVLEEMCASRLVMHLQEWKHLYFPWFCGSGSSFLVLREVEALGRVESSISAATSSEVGRKWSKLALKEVTSKPSLESDLVHTPAWPHFRGPLIEDYGFFGYLFRILMHFFFPSPVFISLKGWWLFGSHFFF